MGEEKPIGPVEKIEERQLLPKNVLCPAFWDGPQYKVRCGKRIVKKAPAVLHYEEIPLLIHDIF
ncbi:MAG: hypothetical protein ACXQTZ_02960, partial [Candidatus Alkanophagales archaeon]